VSEAAHTVARASPEHDGFHELQQLVAARHHVLLNRDDPIAMLQTVNELLVQQTAAALDQAQAAALAKFFDELEVSVSAWKREAKELGERTLDAARRISVQQIEQATQDLLAALAREHERARTTFKRAAALNTLVFIVFAFVVLRALWHH
jgi:CHASE3 domain sensor protein